MIRRNALKRAYWLIFAALCALSCAGAENPSATVVCAIDADCGANQICAKEGGVCVSSLEEKAKATSAVGISPYQLG